MRRLLLLALLGCVSSAAAQPPAGEAGGLVAIALAQYEALLARGQSNRWLPERARYRLAQAGTRLRLSVELEGELRGTGPAEVALPSGELALESATLDGQPTGVLASAGGGGSVLCEQPGRHTVGAAFTMPVAVAGDEFSASLRVPVVASATAELDVMGKQSRVASPDAIVEELRPAGDRTVAKLALLPTGTLAISWGRGTAQPSGARATLGVVQADLLCGVAEDALRVRLVLAPAGHRSETVEPVLLLPAEADLKSVKDADSGKELSARVTTGPAGRRRLVLVGEESRRPVKAWAVEYSLPLPAAAGSIRFDLPRVDGASTQRGLVAWQKPAARAGSVATGGLTTVEAAECPEALRASPSEEIETFYRYAGLPAWMEIGLKTGERPRGTAVAIRELTVRTAIWPDGRACSALKYRLRCEQSGLLFFELAPGMEVVGVFEDGAPASAGRRGQRLAVAPRAAGTDRWAEVELVVTHPAEPPALFSTAALILPTAPATIDSVSWELAAPPDHELRRPRGTLELKLDATGAEGLEAPRDRSGGPARSAGFARSSVAPGDRLAADVFVVSGGLVRGLELLLFLLAAGLPLAALAMKGDVRAAPLAALPAVLATLVLGPLLPAPWRPLVSGVIVAAALAALGAIAFDPGERP